MRKFNRPFKRWNREYATPWSIDLAYNQNDWSIEMDQFIEGVVGRTCAMAGSGFGLRDMQFEFGFRIWHKWQAIRAFNRLVKLYKTGFIDIEYVEICEPYDYRDDETEPAITT